MKKAVLTIEIESELSLVELITTAKKALKVFDITDKGSFKVVQIQANRLKYKIK